MSDCDLPLEFSSCMDSPSGISRAAPGTGAVTPASPTDRAAGFLKYPTCATGLWGGSRMRRRKRLGMLPVSGVSETLPPTPRAVIDGDMSSRAYRVP